MDGMLSQDEINALLAGMDMSDSSTDTTASAGATEEELLSDMEKVEEKHRRDIQIVAQIRTTSKLVIEEIESKDSLSLDIVDVNPERKSNWETIKFCTSGVA